MLPLRAADESVSAMWKTVVTSEPPQFEGFEGGIITQFRLQNLLFDSMQKVHLRSAEAGKVATSKGLMAIRSKTRNLKGFDDFSLEKAQLSRI